MQINLSNILGWGKCPSCGTYIKTGVSTTYDEATGAEICLNCRAVIGKP